MTTNFTSDAELPEPYTRDLAGRGGNADFGHWAGVQKELIEAPLNDISDKFRVSRVDGRNSKELVSTLMQGMSLQLRAPASRFSLNIRLSEVEIRVMEEFLVLTEGRPDDEEITLAQGVIENPIKLDLPTTRNGANARIAESREAIKVFRQRIARAKAKNAYYDICPLIDWYYRPEATRGSPEPHLPFFGQELWSVLGMDSQGLALGHRQSIGAHQISAEMGGSADGEDERTNTARMVDKIFGRSDAPTQI